MRGPPTVTAVVLTYNGRHLLEATLPSFVAQAREGTRIVVVDNGSTDGTADWLREHWPQVNLVRHASNCGVTAALNSCLDAAETDLVGLFNNDVELAPDCLAELVRAMREHPQAAAASPKLLSYHDRGVIDGAGDIYAWVGSGGRRGHGERDHGQFEAPCAIFGVCGGAAVFRREALSEIGVFDDAFFAFYEDVDWSFRAQLAGFSIRYVPTAIAYHMGSATLGQGMTDFTRYHTTRNQIWVVVKDWPLASIARHVPQLVHLQLVHLASALRAGSLTVVLRAWRDAVGGLPAMLRKRRVVQRSRTVAIRELEAVVRER
ncbi:MAG: glycosyltransferase family 2 protein [Actinomycetota bacterium]|nr:glycosyltransferase family 2 protein [Actinomycetota bacterium]